LSHHISERVSVENEAMEVSQSPKYRERVVLLAPQCAGSEWLDDLLHLNFPEKVYELETVEHENLLVWKHSLPSRSTARFAKQLVEAFKPDRVRLLLLSRSPVSQLTSWMHNPHTLEPCVDSFLANEDTCTVLSGNPHHAKVEDYPEQVMSIADVYDRYMSFYHELQKKRLRFPERDACDVRGPRFQHKRHHRSNGAQLWLGSPSRRQSQRHRF